MLKISDCISCNKVVLLDSNLVIIIKQSHPRPLHHISKVDIDLPQLQNIQKYILYTLIQLLRIPMDVRSGHSEQSSDPMCHQWRSLLSDHQFIPTVLEKHFHCLFFFHLFHLFFLFHYVLEISTLFTLSLILIISKII